MGVKYKAISAKVISCLIAIALSCSLVSCDRINLPLADKFSIPEIKNVGFDGINSLSEVAPPELIQQLDQTLKSYQPQVSILRPKLNETLANTEVEVVLKVEDYPLFKDEKLGLGPHLNLIVDNEHYAEIYDLQESIIVKDLKPGTHSLRVLAEKPWHESFKNIEAFAQTTFNVLTATVDNIPEQNTPLLTYNQPSGIYNDEPILLDFYLADIEDQNWQVEAKINEESFIIDEWQPVYLKGFQEGNNLIELKLLDSNGNPIENEFNQPIRLITYNPSDQTQKTLTQLFNNEIAFQDAVAITTQDYYIQPIEEPAAVEAIEEPTVTEPEDVTVIEEPTAAEPSAVETIEEPEETSIEDLPTINSTEPSVEDNAAEILDTDLESEPESSDVEETSLDLEKRDAIADNIEEAIETANNITISETPQETTITLTPPTENESQTAETSLQAPVINSAKKDSISTTSVNDTTALVPKDTSDELPEALAIPIPEEIEAVETEADLDLVQEEESKKITIEIPKPKKLKVPQWWKNLVANLQQRFNLN